MPILVIVLYVRLTLDKLLHNFSQPLFDQRVVLLYPDRQVDVLFELGGNSFILCLVQELGNQVQYLFEER